MRVQVPILCISVQVVEEEAGGEALGATGCSRALPQAADGGTTDQTHAGPLLPRQRDQVPPFQPALPLLKITTTTTSNIHPIPKRPWRALF